MSFTWLKNDHRPLHGAPEMPGGAMTQGLCLFTAIKLIARTKIICVSESLSKTKSLNSFFAAYP
jgi:hypothetical protein